MKLPNLFKIIWWVFLLSISSYFVVKRHDSFITGTVTVTDVLAFLLWISLLLVPLFQEVSFFGVKLKKEIDSLKNDVKDQFLNLRSEIQTSVNLQNRISVVQSYSPGNQEIAEKGEGELPTDGLRVLSTLWHHQKQYYGEELTNNVWTFAVGPNNINYPIYAGGLAETLKRRLVSIAGNGQAMLTGEGMKYCKTHENELLPDWNYDRWNRF